VINTFAALTDSQMKTRSVTIITLSAGALFFCSAINLAAQGTLNWHWDFNQTLYSVNPIDVIYVHATIVNDPSSSTDLTHGSMMSWGIDPSYSQPPYQFVFGPSPGLHPFLDQFDNLDLAPGQSLQFVWGYLTPIGGSVAPDTYHFGPGSLSFDSSSTEYSSGFDVHVVPEPASTSLLVVGLGCWFTRKPKWHRDKPRALELKPLREPK
jgi:hypothetical protein